MSSPTLAARWARPPASGAQAPSPYPRRWYTLAVLCAAGPFQAGIRALPGALALTVASPLGTRLAGRLGIRTSMTAGMLSAAAGLAFFATASGGTGYLTT